jgi:hypothetical protein
VDTYRIHRTIAAIDDGEEVPRRFLVSGGDSAELLELGEAALDEGLGSGPINRIPIDGGL